MDDVRISNFTVGYMAVLTFVGRFKPFADDLAGIVEGKKFERLREAGKISREGKEKKNG